MQPAGPCVKRQRGGCGCVHGFLGRQDRAAHGCLSGHHRGDRVEMRPHRSHSCSFGAQGVFPGRRHPAVCGRATRGGCGCLVAGRRPEQTLLRDLGSPPPADRRNDNSRHLVRTSWIHHGTRRYDTHNAREASRDADQAGMCTAESTLPRARELWHLGNSIASGSYSELEVGPELDSRPGGVP